MDCEQCKSLNTKVTKIKHRAKAEVAVAYSMIRMLKTEIMMLLDKVSRLESEPNYDWLND